MILLYAVMVLILALVVGTVYYNYNTARVREREQQTLEFYAQEIMQQFDSSVKMMEYAIGSLVYDIDVIDALMQCSYAGRNPNYPEDYHLEALKTLHTKLYTDFLKDFYRVIVFNRYGDVVANRSNGKYVVDPDVTWDDIPWLDKVSGRGGKNTLVGLHKDDWGGEEKPIVYSYVKELQGSDMGYIEVQFEQSHIAGLLKTPSTGMEVFLFDTEDQLLYASRELSNAELQAYSAVRQASDASEMAAVHISDYSHCRVLTILPESAVAAQNQYSFNSTILFCLVLAGASLVFVYLISSYLTKPIEQLQRVIGRTRIDNIGQPVAESVDIKRMQSIQELNSLMTTYEDMTRRLAASIEAERETSSLYMKTQFDALQAQVNPHFIYNVLNVISQRGMMDDDDMICDMCANLAAILRYSTNMKQRLATVEEELEYLSHYAFLQKSRYRDQFSCETDANPQVLQLLIPRLTIQQLVENCMNHGYENKGTDMCIIVQAKREENASIIRVHDCGQGFTPGKMEELRASFAEIRTSMRQRRKTPDLEIGGMGLANVYSRLYLTFGERFELLLLNEDGATVLIRIQDEQQEAQHV